MVARGFGGEISVPVIIEKIDDENIKISNHSLRLDTMRFPINYDLKWNIGGIQHSQTIALSAGSEQTINKSDWRDLDAFPRSTENLKLSIVAQNEHIGFSLGHSRNMSVIEAIDLHETESGIRTTIKIIDMDGNHSTEDYDLELPIESKLGGVDYLEIPKKSNKMDYSECFKNSSITIDRRDIVEETVAKTTKISTTNDMRLLISDIYRLKFTQKGIKSAHKENNNLCFRVINCKENGEEQHQSNEIELFFSDSDVCEEAVNDFNSRSDYYLTENPHFPGTKDTKIISVEIPCLKVIPIRYAFEVVYLKRHHPETDISIFSPHITLRKSKDQAVEITNAEFKYNEDGFPIKLTFTYKMENSFDKKGGEKVKNWTIPPDHKEIAHMRPFFEKINSRRNKFMKVMGKMTGTGWSHKEVFISKSSFISAPYIPIKMNKISEHYTGQGIMENFYFDVFDGTIHTSPPNEFNGRGLIQGWMLEKQVPTVESIAEIQRYFDDVRIWEE